LLDYHQWENKLAWGGTAGIYGDTMPDKGMGSWLQ
jgi:hypothetical protein